MELTVFTAQEGRSPGTHILWDLLCMIWFTILHRNQHNGGKSFWGQLHPCFKGAGTYGTNFFFLNPTYSFNAEPANITWWPWREGHNSKVCLHACRGAVMGSPCWHCWVLAASSVRLMTYYLSLCCILPSSSLHLVLWRVLWVSSISVLLFHPLQCLFCILFMYPFVSS